MSTHVAAWSLSGVQDDTWRIHSSLLLPEDYRVTTLDIKYGKYGSNVGEIHLTSSYRTPSRWNDRRSLGLHVNS
jgi:hypothetical protein